MPSVSPSAPVARTSPEDAAGMVAWTSPSLLAMSAVPVARSTTDATCSDVERPSWAAALGAIVAMTAMPVAAATTVTAVRRTDIERKAGISKRRTIFTVIPTCPDAPIYAVMPCPLSSARLAIRRVGPGVALGQTHGHTRQRLLRIGLSCLLHLRPGHEAEDVQETAMTSALRASAQRAALLRNGAGQTNSALDTQAQSASAATGFLEPDSVRGPTTLAATPTTHRRLQTGVSNRALFPCAAALGQSARSLISMMPCRRPMQ